MKNRVKRCRHTHMQRFTRELKHLIQRQGAFLRRLKCTNHSANARIILRMKCKVVELKKLVFHSGLRFLI